MIRNTILFLSALTLAACGAEPEPAPEPAPTVTPEPVTVHTPPSEDLFKAVFAEACPNAEPVNTAICKHSMGAETASCEYGLGNDDVLRNEAVLALVDDAWTLESPETVCSR